MNPWNDEERRDGIRRSADGHLAANGQNPLTSRELAWALGRPWAQDGDDLEDLAESVAYQVTEVRSAGDAAYQPTPPTEMITLGEGREFPRPPTGPSWWRLETQRRFEQLVPLRDKVLELLDAADGGGYSRPMQTEEMLGRLRRVAAAELRQGPAWSLPVPIGLDASGNLATNELVVWRGPGDSLQSQCLWQVAETAEVVSRKTGCGEDQALAFLLAGEVPLIPWVQSRYDGVNGVIELQVRNARVSPSDVAIAYRSLRDGLFGRRRRGGEWRRLAETFDRDMRGSGEHTSWSKVFGAFKAQYPDQPYATLQSFQHAVYQRRKQVPKA